MAKKPITWHTEKRKLGQLKKWPRNPRTHTKKQAEDLQESLTKFNLVVPLVINTDDTIIGGHPVKPHRKPGPMEAVKEFLKTNKNFIIDKSREKFYLTFNRNGYLKKIK